jgi:predicted amidohydrolase
MGLQDTDKLAIAEPAGRGIMQEFLAEMARSLKVWIIGGTIPLQSAEAGKVMNTTLVFDPQGVQRVRYDKIHLFGFSKGEESYEEARTITAGEQVTTFETEAGGLVCLFAMTYAFRNYSARWSLFPDRCSCCFYLHHRSGALGNSVARQSDRESVLCSGIGAGRQTFERAPHLGT